MAATAKVNGKILEAARFELRHWLEIQSAIRAGTVHVEMPFCGCRGHCAISVLNRPFFKHYPSEAHCEYASADESAEHLFAKHEIARGIEAAGWVASIEHGSGGGEGARWRADVMAIRDERRAAFEVQRSWQAPHRYLERARKYLSSGLDSVWFVIDDPRGVRKLDTIVPAFDLRGEFNSAVVHGFGASLDEEKPLAEFVCDWLLGQRPEGHKTPTPNPARTRGVAYPGRSLFDRGPAVVPEREPNWMPQRNCPMGCKSPGMSYSSILDAWVCMTCRHVSQ